MLLLFDGIAVLLPEQEREWFCRQDEALIAGLKEHGALRCIRPEDAVDRQACHEIVIQTLNLLSSKEVQQLPRDDPSMEFYISKFGHAIDPDLIQDLLGELRNHNLARSLFSPHSVAMHPALGVLILSEVGRHVIRYAQSQGIDVFPSTDKPELHDFIRRAGGSVSLSHTTKIVATDMQAAGISLGSVPIDEIVSFRREHQDLLNRYRLGITEAAHDFEVGGHRLEDTLLRERRERLEASKASIDGYFRAWLKDKARVGIGLLGAVVNLAAGNPIGAGLSVAGTMAGTSPTPPVINRMSYIISAGQRFGTL